MTVEKPSRNEAVAALGVARRLLSRSNSVAAAVDAAQRNLELVADRFRETRAQAALAEIPIERLNASGARNIRTAPLRAAGFENLAQVSALSPADLERFPGVGPHSANVLALAVREVALEVGKSSPRLDVEHLDPMSLEVLVALRAQRVLEEGLREMAFDLDRARRELPSLISAAEPLTQPIRYRLARRERKQRAADAVGAILHWKAWVQEPSIAERLVALNSAVEESSRALDPPAIEADFERYAAAYYTTLERLDPGQRVSDEGLPAVLVERVDAIDLRTRHLRATLRRYQEFGAKFAIAQQRVLIADEMGLGKTLQALATVAHVREISNSRHFLVVCPAAVLINWLRETAEHTRLFAIQVHGANRDAAWTQWSREGGVAITTFDTLKSLDLQLVPRLGVLVVDEAHNVKNPRAHRTVVVERVSGSAERIILLSGTPMQNRLEEFRNLVMLLQPAAARKLAAASAIAGPQAFRQAAAEVYLRRNVEEVAGELPELTEIDEWEGFSASDLAVYRKAVKAGNFMWMRRAAFEGQPSAKLERLVQLCAEAHANGRKVIVFSFFRDVLARVAATVPGTPFGPLTGDIPVNARQQMVDSFTQCQGPATLVAQITAGGEGLNIQAASVVILCEPQIKPALEQQAIARARRLGQTKRVQVHRLLVADSVDQRMLEILGEKQRLFDTYVRQSAAAERSSAAKDPNPTNLAAEVVRLERLRLGIAS